MPRPAAVFIFNYAEFNESVSDLANTDIHVNELEKTFKQFQCEVHLHRDLTFAQIQSVMESLKKKDFSKYSGVVFAFMSHGEANGMVCAKDQPFHFSREFVLKISKNETLKDKAKIYLVYARRGRLHTTLDTSLDRSRQVKAPPPTRTLLFSSCPYRHESYDEPDDCVPFIGFLCRNLREYGKRKDIETIVRMTQDDLKCHFKKNADVSDLLLVDFKVPYCFGDYIIE